MPDMSQNEPRPAPPIDRPLDVRMIDDEIVIIGPGPVAFSMTVEAARETCRLLGEILEAQA
jgi:hypothetical protein